MSRTKQAPASFHLCREILECQFAKLHGPLRVRGLINCVKRQGLTPAEARQALNHLAEYGLIELAVIDGEACAIWHGPRAKGGDV